MTAGRALGAGFVIFVVLASIAGGVWGLSLLFPFLDSFEPLWVKVTAVLIICGLLAGVVVGIVALVGTHDIACTEVSS